MTAQTILHYRILERIGRGGMGEVYKAEDTRLGRLVALKFLPPAEAPGSPEAVLATPGSSPHTPQALERFRREARAASLLNHAHICTIHDVGEHDGQPFIVMEYLEGETLKACLTRAQGGASSNGGEGINAGASLEIDEVLELAVQIADGLEAAHAKGIIHRDIKPANIFIMARRQAKILDFGLAKLTKAPAPAAVLAGTLSLDEITSRGAALGTFAYMSPEQARGQELDARSDIFSFGLVLYEMAEGLHVSGARSKFSAVTRSMMVRRLRTIISKALERDRTARYQTAALLKKDLERLRRETTRAPYRAGVISRRWLRALGALLTAGLLAAGSYYVHVRRAAALGDKHSIVLAEFSNLTGDQVFNGTLREALAVSLEQSPLISILSDEKLAATLRLMERPADTPLKPEVAREVCQRAGSKAYISGSVASLGSQYVLELKAVACQSGDTLAQGQATADGKEKVLDALDKTATELRRKLGESLTSVEKFDAPLGQATTSSFEALKAYSLGLKSYRERGFAAALPFFQRAIELDTNFALVYEDLGLGYANLGENALASTNLRKAYQLRARVSERERLYIVAQYYLLVTGGVEKARETYESWAATYPQDPMARGSLAVADSMLGRHDQALQEGLEAYRLDPQDNIRAANLMNFYMALGRLQDAGSIYTQAREKKLDSDYLHFLRYDLAFLEQDPSGMAEQVIWSRGQAGIEDVLLAYESDTEAYHGRLASARELSRQAVASAERAGERETAAGWQADAALREALVGNAAEASACAASALRLSRGRDVSAAVALALAFAGDQQSANKIADDLAHRFPDDTAVNSNYLPAIRAAAAIAVGKPGKAIEILQVSLPHELGFPTVNSLTLNLYPVYVRGQAYLALRRGQQAADEFHTILDHPGIVINEPIRVLALIRLAQAHTLEGDTVAAHKEYEAFFSLWKKSNPDVPVLRQARLSYANL